MLHLKEPVRRASQLFLVSGRSNAKLQVRNGGSQISNLRSEIHLRDLRVSALNCPFDNYFGEGVADDFGAGAGAFVPEAGVP